MKGRCHHFLAAARFAGHQHIDIRIGNMPERHAQALHGGCLPDQRQVVLRLPGCPAKRAIFQHEAALFEGSAGAFHHPFGGKRLGYEVIGAVVERINGHGYIAMAGNEDDRQIRIDLADMVEKFQPGHAGHAHISDNDAVEIFTQSCKRLLGSGKGSDRQPV